MKDVVVFKSDKRGKTIYKTISHEEYLTIRHSFHFGSYKNPKLRNFGALEALNDMVVGNRKGFGIDKYNADSLEGVFGFGKHFHGNMEIITVPLSGKIEFQDNKGYFGEIEQGDVHLSSTGIGIMHAEYNHHETDELRVLQLWIFPKIRDTVPKYSQITLKEADSHNQLQLIVSPFEEDHCLCIKQDAWIYKANFESGFSVNYTLKAENHCVFIFVIKGKLKVLKKDLEERDAIGIRNHKQFEILAKSEAEFLVVESVDFV